MFYTRPNRYQFNIYFSSELASCVTGTVIKRRGSSNSIVTSTTCAPGSRRGGGGERGIHTHLVRDVDYKLYENGCHEN